MANLIDNISSPFVKFDPKTWASFKHSSEKLTFKEEDLEKFLAFNDKLTLEEVQNIYLPLSSLLRMYYISRHDRLAVLQKFLGYQMASVPFIISISGSVSVGKTTTAKLLLELIRDWPCKPKVSMITTDGFLYPNSYLEEHMLLGRKGFPASYDVKRLINFLLDIKEGKPNLKVPVYSHMTYDIVPDEYTIVDRPDVLILEGVNVLQDGTDYPEYRKKAFISDYIDYSIYVDADEKHLMKWYIDRFLKLREKAFSDPNCYFHKYAQISDDNATSIAKLIWEAVNHTNLIENILPCRNRASLILKKGEDHHIEEIYLRK
ncbi:MAG: type I pantothenate kinase [Succinivibrio sp.]